VLFRSAVEALVNADAASAAAAALELSLSADHFQPAAADQWVRLGVFLGYYGLPDRIAALAPRPELFAAAVSAYLGMLEERHDRVGILAFVHRSRNALRRDTKVWADVAYYLLFDRRAARDWVRDWRTREGLEPWMLVNVVLALRRAKLDGEAADAGRLALSLPRRDPFVDAIHRLWLAFDAVTSRPPGVDAHLQAIDANLLAAHDRFHDVVFQIVAAAGAVVCAAPERRAQAFAQARRELRSIGASRLDNLQARVFRRCALSIGRARATLFARLWSWACCLAIALTRRY
jgi:hypothetical protein